MTIFMILLCYVLKDEGESNLIGTILHFIGAIIVDICVMAVVLKEFL